MSRLDSLNAVYIESIGEAHELIAKFKYDIANRVGPALYVGLDTETEPPKGGISEDALRWWGKKPGKPFLYIVGWSTNLGKTPPVYYLIPEEFEWAFVSMVEVANAEPAVEWVFFNRTFDLGMVELSAGIKIKGRTHEAFTTIRVSGFLPDWWENNKLKAIMEQFVDPAAGEPEDRLKLWKAAYESARGKALTAMLQSMGKDPVTGKWLDKTLKMTKTTYNTYKDEGIPLPLHVLVVENEWKKQWPEFSYAIVPKEIIIPYGINDVKLTLWMFYIGMTLMQERQVMATYEREQRLYPFIRDESIRGWKVDREAIEKAHVACVGEDGAGGRLAEITAELKVLVDYMNCETLSDAQREDGFNPGSGPQMLKLFANIGLHVENLEAYTLLRWVKDEAGNRTKWADAIEKFQEYKLYSKLHGTYVKVIKFWSQWDSVLHASIRQDGAFTGRKSVVQPALQTIPRKKVKEFNVRQFFMPMNEDYRLWMFDFSGMEVAVFAEYCRDPVMLDALEKGADFHSMLALRAFPQARYLVEQTLIHMAEHGAVTRVTCDDAIMELGANLTVNHILLEHIKEYMEKNCSSLFDLYKAFRQAAKTGMFSILYGSGDEKLAFQMTKLSGIYISPYVAGQFKATFFGMYVGAKQFVDACAEQVSMRQALAPIMQHNRQYGWARNMYGRLFLLEKRDAYKLPNWLVQGSCADMLKEKKAEIGEFLAAGGYKSRMILPIHDEIVFELHKSEERELVPILKAMMENIPELEVAKLKVEASWCSGSWATKKTFHSWEEVDAA